MKAQALPAPQFHVPIAGPLDRKDEPIPVLEPGSIQLLVRAYLQHSRETMHLRSPPP